VSARPFVLALFLAAAPAGGEVGTLPGPVETRICASLEEAAGPAPGAVLIVFFSTECRICYDDLFESRYLVDRRGFDLAVVGVYSGLRDELRSFLEKYRWDLPVVLDRRKALFRRFDVDAVPFKALLVGKEEVYRDDARLGLAARREELERCLTRLLSR